MLAREHRAGFAWCAGVKPAGYPAKWVYERRRIPYGILLHGGDLLRLRHRIHRSLLTRRAARALLRSAAVFVADCRRTRDLALAVLREAGVSTADDPVRVVPPGADPERFRPGLDAAGVRARHGLDDGRWLLTAARFTSPRSIAVALRAFARLGARDAGLRYAIAGRGERLDELRALAARLGVADRVRFLPGIAEADLPALYNAAAVYVAAARLAGRGGEGFGAGALEASACGRPVVAGGSGETLETVRDGETGLLVDETPEAVAGAVERVLADGALAERLGRGGRHAVETYFNWDRVTADLIGIAQEFRGSATLPADIGDAAAESAATGGATEGAED
jgi:phosphatidylinositol alpha-1,6-mannosyltransferase